MSPLESLLWVGEPPSASGRRIGAVAIGLLFIFTVAIFFITFPPPPHMGFRRIAGLVFGVALFCSVPFTLIRFGLKGDRIKAYALTNQRLLIAVGRRYQDVRMVALTALAPVQVVRWMDHDKMVQFSLSATGFARYSRPIWTSLESGRLDLRTGSTWYVDDPHAVRNLIEDARTAARTLSSSAKTAG